MSLHRRHILLGLNGLAATALLSSCGVLSGHRASPGPPGRKMWINGNLLSPIDDDAPLDARTAAAVRASGLTAYKASLGGSGSDYKETLDEIAEYDRGLGLNPDLYLQIRTLADLDTAQASSCIGIIYSFESVGMLDGKLDRIDEFSKRGVRVMQLCYNLPSPFASGVMSRTSTGLTPLGHEAVARMNALGVGIDVSHSDARSTLETAAVSRKPVSITHAGCSAVHDHPRNKTDQVLRAVANQGGVTGIYELSYLNGGVHQPTLDEYMAHLMHALDVCGEDHTGIGSDASLDPFDTGPENMTRWNKAIAERKRTGVAAPGEGPPPFVVELNRSDRFAVIAAELARRGVNQAAIDKILGLNFRRWYAETWPA